MYIPAHFAETRPAALHDLMRAHPLATVVTMSSAGLVANHLPLHVHVGEDGGVVLQGHVARANPLWREDVSATETLAVFQGAGSYITPAWYPAKREHGRVVPTWNYAAVHAYGRLRAIDDPARVRGIVARLTDEHEAGRGEPWSLADAPADYIERMLRAIVGIELVVTRLEGKWKMSQNQPAPNRAGVVAGLRAETGDEGRAVARMAAAAGGRG